MSGPPETPEERQRRLQQTRFGIEGSGTRQTRLLAGEQTLGGGLYVAAGPKRRPAYQPPPKTLAPPGPQVTEYGGERLQRAPVVAIPAPAPPLYVAPQQTFGVPPGRPAPAPEVFNVRVIPPDVTRAWRAPFVLRPYQQEAVRRFHEFRKGTVVYPTGVGKSDIAIAAINDLRIPTVIIVPTLVLVDQWRRMLANWGIQSGQWTGVVKEPSYVTVSTYQSLFEDPSLIRRFPFIIFDEAHRATAEQFSRLIFESQQHPFALALTATLPTETSRQDLLGQYLPVLVRQAPAEAIGAGHLVPVRVVPVATALSGQERVEYDQLSHTLADAARRMGTSNPSQVQRLLSSLQLRGAAVAFLRALSRRRALLSNVASKRATLLEIVRRHPRERILVFSESVPAIEDTCEYLRSNGIGCHTITGQTDERSRRFAIENWGRTFWVLASVKVLELGFNVPEVGVAVFLASGTGRLQLTQRLGRILRLAPGKTQAVAYVVYAPDTVEVGLARRLQQLAGQQLSVEGRTSIEEFEEPEA